LEHGIATVRWPVCGTVMIAGPDRASSPPGP
jgi:hypothetical protein